MLTIITMAIGFLSSLAPEFIKKWQDSSDKKHEITLLQLQMQQAASGHAYKMDEIGVQAYGEIVQSAHKEQATSLDKASKWVVDLSAGVRPIVTYIFVIAFIGFKIAAFFAAINPALPWQDSMNYSQAMLLVWGAEESAGFWGIIAYWFGAREMQKKRP